MDYVNILIKIFFCLVIFPTLALIGWAIYYVNEADQNWENFSKTHNCKLVEVNLITRGYLCDDGVTYRR